MQFIPKERMNLIALEYIESVQSILQAFSNMVNVTAVTNEVNWSKRIYSKGKKHRKEDICK